MKRLIATSLSALLLTAVGAPAVWADSPTRMSAHYSPTVTQPSIGAFNLVYLAYQGYLESEGIPRAGLLLTEAIAGNVTAQQLVQAAIKAGHLSADSVTNTLYLADVQYELDHLPSRQ